MPGIKVSTLIDASPRLVWDRVRDISTHVDWMADAEAIRFTSRSRRGVGTTFECDTRVGPITLTDLMEVTSWVERREMGVRHTGVVTGVGRFTLRRGPVLKHIWKGNLRRLKAGFER